MKWLLFLFLLLLPSLADAACTGSSPTWTSTPDQASVQACVTGATSGDTINVSAGTVNWATPVSIIGKGLTLTGATVCSGTPVTCTDNTNITSTNTTTCVLSGGCALVTGGMSTTKFVNVSGFTFIKSANNSQGIVQLSSGAVPYQVGFRFHHNHIIQASAGGRGISTFGTYGLIDHNHFDVIGACISVQSLSLYGSIPSTTGGYTPWQYPLTLGTENAVYVEDNNIDYDACSSSIEDALDAYSGARFVVRHNTITNVAMGHHGTDSGDMRSPVSFEVYENTFTNNSTTVKRGWTIRGGTGVFFNNTYTGSVSSWNPIQVMYYRACSVIIEVQTWGTTGCDGTNWELGSANYSSGLSRDCTTTGGFRFHGTTNEALGAEGATYTNYFDNGGAAESGSFGYPCRDQPGRGPGQVLEPVYGWNNTGATIGAYDLATTNNCNGHGLAHYLLNTRDYYSDNTTQRPGYTAYTYPHPLQGEEPPPPVPDTPQNLRLVATSGQTATLFWPVSTDAATVGYYVLMGTTTGVYSFTPVATRTAALALSTHSPLTQATITNLPADTYYFTVVGFSSDFTRSEYATEVSATFTALSRSSATARSAAQ